MTRRLFEVKVTDSEAANMTKYNSTIYLTANYHTKLGAAKKNANVRAEMLRGIDGKGNQVEYTYWVRPIEITPEG